MIYTVGVKEDYDRGIADKAAAGQRLQKRGMGQIDGVMYRGGMVWVGREAAAQYAAGVTDQVLAVYGVEADWDRDTMDYGEGYRRLVVDRPLVRLDG